MKLILITFILGCIFLQSSSALPTKVDQTEDELKVAEYFRNLLIELRSLMRTGDEQLGIPILDPFHDKDRAVRWNSRDWFGSLICEGRAQSTNGVITGLSTFVIKDVIFSFDNLWDLTFILDFPDYVHTGSFETDGSMPNTFIADLGIIGPGTYRVEATPRFENGTEYPGGGSSHLVELTAWLNLNPDGTMWLQSMHGYVNDYKYRKTEVTGLRPSVPMFITERIREKLDTYGNSYLAPSIDQDGRNQIYRGLQDYLQYKIEGVRYDDIINGKGHFHK